MIEKPTRPKQPSIQERQPPRTLQELVNRYDLDNTKIYDFLDGLSEEVNTQTSTTEQSLSDMQTIINNLSGNIISLNTDKENKSNKVTSISSSSTNTQYPSAKLLYDSIYYKTGDTYSCSYFPVSGFISSGTTEIVLGLTLPKRLDNITSISVTQMSAMARGNSGYINNNSSNYDFLADSSHYTITATKRSVNGVQISIVKNTAFTNVTNNTIVNLACYIGLKFN